MTTSPQTEDRRASLRAANRRLGWVIASVAAVFFFGVIIKYWIIR